MQVTINLIEIPDELTDKSIDLNKHPAVDELHEKKTQVRKNQTEMTD